LYPNNKYSAELCPTVERVEKNLCERPDKTFVIKWLCKLGDSNHHWNKGLESFDQVHPNNDGHKYVVSLQSQLYVTKLYLAEPCLIASHWTLYSLLSTEPSYNLSTKDE